ncbi:hypothetical protein QCA50_016180 [Cerrena zonata]|uniref:Pheromone receptor n=1 Tax=Cerrena zonata TaxID=2478898 RepID=A0AAW0FPI0_9APHY
MISSDPTYPLYPIVSFIGLVLSLVPLPWHLQAWNSGTCFFMMWTALASLNKFVNSVVWAGNAIDSAPAWCEISTRITIGVSIGIPAASLCINRRLYKIARVSAVTISRAEKRRAVIIDTLICIVFPCICMALAYIVQGHRYDIFEDLGCRPAIFNTVPAYFLVSMWPIVIGSISAVYCILSLRALLARQAQFNQFLSAGSSLTMSRYLRLMALAFTDLCLTVPLGIYQVCSNAVGGDVEPWRGWADAHFNFNRVGQFPAGMWRADRNVEIPLELDRWIVPCCAFIFFAYFGFAEEARRNYVNAYRFVTAPFRKLRSKSSSEKLADEHSKASSFQTTSPSVPEFLPPYTSHANSRGSFLSIDKKEKIEFDDSQPPHSSIPFIMPDVPVSPSSSSHDDTLSYYAQSVYHAV